MPDSKSENKNESTEQPAFWRTHNARETARASRVKAQQGKSGKTQTPTRGKSK